MKTIKSFLPVFTGFYGTYFEGIVDNQVDSILNRDEEDGLLLTYDDVDFNYTQLRNDISKLCVNLLENELSINNFKISITFEKLVSPREYNFTTDEIQCIYKFSNKTLKGLLDLVINNSASFDIYIRQIFDSRSGFASFNDGIKWEEVLQRYEEFFGYILQFLCDEILDYTDEQMADRVEGNVSLDYAVKVITR